MNAYIKEMHIENLRIQHDVVQSLALANFLIRRFRKIFSDMKNAIGMFRSKAYDVEIKTRCDILPGFAV